MQKIQTTLLVDKKISEALYLVSTKTARPISHIVQDAIILYLIQHATVSDKIAQLLQDYVKQQSKEGLDV